MARTRALPTARWTTDHHGRAQARRPRSSTLTPGGTRRLVRVMCGLLGASPPARERGAAPRSPRSTAPTDAVLARLLGWTVLFRFGGPLTEGVLPVQLAYLTRLDGAVVARALGRLHAEGLVTRGHDGRYALPRAALEACAYEVADQSGLTGPVLP
ncbi:MAG: hypothetical protein IRY91_14490 [Gemmatimonadaceae bacterium]|nr:hypothetical protein [Gemmatimonadaceae bacterium]